MAGLELFIHQMTLVKFTVTWHKRYSLHLDAEFVDTSTRIYFANHYFLHMFFGGTLLKEMCSEGWEVFVP